eukprot:TRINITY_DN4078_c0_g1_i2.p1 TRINITY_DN4078_c0_g1~~TRINITY_DN4078_c0_g1_i2.p1  ORF type:complete len:96 (+),score=10.43 TRINITY_DN4078_c0_g1_i2:772-1059(+)
MACRGDILAIFLRHLFHFLKELDSNQSFELPSESGLNQFCRDVNCELSVFLHMALIHYVLDNRVTQHVGKDSTTFESDASLVDCGVNSSVWGCIY